MDLLCGSEQKLCDLEEEMNFLDNDMFQPTPTLVSHAFTMEPYGQNLYEIFFRSAVMTVLQTFIVLQTKTLMFHLHNL